MTFNVTTITDNSSLVTTK